jgi:hypothetical protein
MHFWPRFPQEEARKAKEILKLEKYYKLGASAMVVHHHMQRAKTLCNLVSLEANLSAAGCFSGCHLQQRAKLSTRAQDSLFQLQRAKLSTTPTCFFNQTHNQVFDIIYTLHTG